MISCKPIFLQFCNQLERLQELYCFSANPNKVQINDELMYEMDNIRTVDMKSSKAMILAVMNAIFAIA